MAKLDHRLLLAHSFALLNPLQVESELWDDLPLIPLQSGTYPGMPSQLPMLLDLSLLPTTERIALLDRCTLQDRHSRKPFFSALLVSDTTSDHLSRHMSRQLLLKRSHKSAALLRYFDPAVFTQLTWLFEERQLDALLGPITKWTWRDGTGSWQSLRRRANQAARIQPNAEQWGMLSRLGTLNRALRALQSELPEVASDKHLARRMDALLRQAIEDHALKDESDIQLYVSQALKFHPNLHRHPVLVKRLSVATTGETSYVDACSDLEDAQLRTFSLSDQNTMSSGTTA